MISAETKKVLNIAKYQKRVLLFILIGLFVIQSTEIAILIGIINSIYVYKWAEAFESKSPLYFAVTALIPLLGVVPLLILSSNSTIFLSKHGGHGGITWRHERRPPCEHDLIDLCTTQPRGRLDPG